MKAYLEIEMPKNCNECPLHFYEGQGICSCCALPTIEDDEILKPWKNRRKDCPLIPIQEHGRLIDADTLKKILVTAIPQYSLAECTTYADSDIMRWIDEAPTIIPAEPAEEGE